jgi:hypothetical protein
MIIKDLYETLKTFPKDSIIFTPSFVNNELLFIPYKYVVPKTDFLLLSEKYDVEPNIQSTSMNAFISLLSELKKDMKVVRYTYSGTIEVNNIEFTTTESADNLLFLS